MKVATISTYLYAKELEEKVQEQFNQLSSQLFIPRCEMKQIEEIIYFHYEVEDHMMLKFYQGFLGEKLRTYISHGIFQVIQQTVQYHLLQKLIEKEYGFLSAQEKTQIFQQVKKTLHTPKSKAQKESKQKAKDQLRIELIGCMEENTTFNLEGFICFRMIQYKEYLSTTLQRCIQEWKVQQEYRQFIELLQTFLSTQPSEIQTLHVVGQEEGKIIILNEKKQDITSWCIQEFIKEIPEKNWCYEDVLIATVLQLVPTQIILHQQQYILNQRLIHTLQLLFPSTLVICSSCELCLRQSSHGKIGVDK